MFHHLFDSAALGGILLFLFALTIRACGLIWLPIRALINAANVLQARRDAHLPFGSAQRAGQKPVPWGI